MQGSAERAEAADRQSLSGRVEALSHPRSAVPGRGHEAAAAPNRRYYDWVDQFDTLGLGKNVPIATGNLSDAMFALVDGKWVTMRVPYPMGFFAKGMDGRIDNPNTGWKGKGMYVHLFGPVRRAHIEGGKGQTTQSGALPAPPRPAGEVERSTLRQGVGGFIF